MGTGMAYSLKEAAEAAGKGKPAILKAIQNGKISAQKDEHGQWQIEPVELHRVYPPVSGNGSDTASKMPEETMGNANGNSLLEREIQFLRERLADIERLSETERRLLSNQIEDLRRDREDMRGERDRLLKVIEDQAGSVRLLTDQSQKAEMQPVIPERRGLFSWFGRRSRAG